MFRGLLSTFPDTDPLAVWILALQPYGHDSGHDESVSGREVAYTAPEGRAENELTQEIMSPSKPGTILLDHPSESSPTIEATNVIAGPCRGTGVTPTQPPVGGPSIEGTDLETCRSD